MKIKLYEIDGGPSGIFWEGQTDSGEYLRGWDNEDEMLVDAKVYKSLGHTLRFYTQAEYLLNEQIGEYL